MVSTKRPVPLVEQIQNDKLHRDIGIVVEGGLAGNYARCRPSSRVGNNEN